MSEEATFAAGCFWQVEIDFANTPGVLTTMVGYTGGATDSPSYEEVCTGATGHAEAVHLTFDPEQVSYERAARHLLWPPRSDPAQPPGPRRSATSTARRSSSTAPSRSAKRSPPRSAPATEHRNPVVTEIVPAEHFWLAEDYHQRYLEKRGMATCRVPSAAA